MSKYIYVITTESKEIWRIFANRKRALQFADELQMEYPEYKFKTTQFKCRSTEYGYTPQLHKIWLTSHLTED